MGCQYWQTHKVCSHISQIWRKISLPEHDSRYDALHSMSSPGGANDKHIRSSGNTLNKVNICAKSVDSWNTTDIEKSGSPFCTCNLFLELSLSSLIRSNRGTSPLVKWQWYLFSLLKFTFEKVWRGTEALFDEVHGFESYRWELSNFPSNVELITVF